MLKRFLIGFVQPALTERRYKPFPDNHDRLWLLRDD